MVQKKNDFDLDDELNNNLDEELGEDFIEDVIIDEEFGDGDIVESDDSVEEEDFSDEDIMVKFNTNNHKLEGKHSLKRDTIFNGKIVENTEESDYGQMGESEYSFSDSPLEKGTLFEEESRNSDYFINNRNLEIDVFTLLDQKTEIDFKSNRRKPNKIVFNSYYEMLLEEVGKKYTKSEIFVSLSYYFTDNIFNMYKLLEKNYAMGIIRELKEKGHLKGIPDFQ